MLSPPRALQTSRRHSPVRWHHLKHFFTCEGSLLCGWATLVPELGLSWGGGVRRSALTAWSHSRGAGREGTHSPQGWGVGTELEVLAGEARVQGPSAFTVLRAGV